MGASPCSTRPGPADRKCWAALAAAWIAYAALVLWLTRGVTFLGDELAYFADADGFSPGSILEPHNGHLIAFTRLSFAASLELFGAAYLPVKLLMIAAVVACSALVFVIVKRRLGPVAALAPAILILFLGASRDVLIGSSAVFPQAVAFGLAAWALLDRDRRGAGTDLAACAALTASVMTLEVGLGFVVGAAVLVAVDSDRWRRAWIVAVPVVLYACWYLWSLKFDQDAATASNVLLFPQWAADSLAAATAVMSGLAVSLTGAAPSDAPLATAATQVPLDWGYVLAAGLAIAVLARLRRVAAGRLLLAALAMMATLWLAGALGFGEFRSSAEARYTLPIVVGVILILAEAFARVRWSRGGLLALAALTAAAIATNVWVMREQGEVQRASSESVRVVMATLELERTNAPPQLALGLPADVTVGDYLAAFDRHGTLATDPDRIASAAPEQRAVADSTLDRLLALRLTPAARSDPPGGCDSVALGPGQAAEVELPAGGATLEAHRPAEVKLRRFADEPTIELGALEAGRPAAVAIPADDLTAVPWRATLAPAQRVEVCPLDGSG